MPALVPVGIGPHEGRELELMLVGRKPLALPAEALQPDFDALVLSGQLTTASVRIRTLVKRTDVIGRLFGLSKAAWHEARFYSRIGQDARLQSVCAIYRDVSARFPMLGLTEFEHATVGWLLGYSDVEISAFLDHWQRHPTR